MDATTATSVNQRFTGLSDDEVQVLDQADRFARAELYPLSKRMDDEEWWPPEAFPKIGANGYFGIPLPQEYGGAGMDMFTSGLVTQAFARWNHALALSCSTSTATPTRRSASVTSRACATGR
jgi:isovaleryl-CoA dehydrogenase